MWQNIFSVSAYPCQIRVKQLSVKYSILIPFQIIYEEFNSKNNAVSSLRGF